MPKDVLDIMTQGGLGILAAILYFAWQREAKAREADRAEYQKSLAAERDACIKMVDKERSENTRLQGEVMRIAQEAAATNAQNQRTLEDLRQILGTTKKRKAAL